MESQSRASREPRESLGRVSGELAGPSPTPRIDTDAVTLNAPPRMADVEPEVAAEPPTRPSLPREPDAPRARRVRRALWLVLPLVALAELVGYQVIVARVPAEADWDTAAAAVRAELTETDRVVSAPYWTDPLLREHLGDQMGFEMAAPSDSAPYDRLFELSIRGHLSDAAPPRPADAEERYGRVTVRRWDLGPSTVRYNFVQSIQGAVVEHMVDGAARPCTWRRAGMSRHTGLAQGHIIPDERFVCGPGIPWVGATVMENLDYRPHYCIYQHPKGPDPMRATFRNVPLGDRVVIYGGLYNRHEREGTGAPITARVRVDGESVGALVHRDLEGWASAVIPTRSAEAAAADPDARGDITVEVFAPNAGYRSFCWTGTVRSGEREGEL